MTVAVRASCKFTKQRHVVICAFPQFEMRAQRAQHLSCTTPAPSPPNSTTALFSSKSLFTRLPTLKPPTKTRMPGIKIPHPQSPSNSPYGNSHDHCITASRNSTAMRSLLAAHPTRAVGDNQHNTSHRQSITAHWSQISTAPPSFGPWLHRQWTRSRGTGDLTERTKPAGKSRLCGSLDRRRAAGGT